VGDAQSERHETIKGSARRTVTCADALSQAFYPLTLPLTVGPGSISIAITLGANAPQHLVPNLLVILAAAIGSAFLAVTIYLCYAYADRLASKLGPTGTTVILKLTAFLLMCIGVADLVDGASKLLSSLPQFAGVAALPH